MACLQQLLNSSLLFHLQETVTLKQNENRQQTVSKTVKDLSHEFKENKSISNF